MAIVLKGFDWVKGKGPMAIVGLWWVGLSLYFIKSHRSPHSLLLHWDPTKRSVISCGCLCIMLLISIEDALTSKVG